jgi:hypothetical protein
VDGAGDVNGGNGGQGDNGAAVEVEADEEYFQVQATAGPLCWSRLIIGGLAAPYISTMFGNVLADVLPQTVGKMHPFDRVLCGAITYVGIKSGLKWAYARKTKALHAHRRILNFSAL